MLVIIRLNRRICLNCTISAYCQSRSRSTRRRSKLGHYPRRLAAAVGLAPRPPSPRADEVDIAALHVRVHELHAKAVADPPALEPLLKLPLDRGVEKADPEALLAGAGDCGVELLPDPWRQQQRGRGLDHLALDLLR